MKNIYDNLKDIVGKPIDPATGEPMEFENELDNFYTCEHCGQAVDKRSLGQVFHHEGFDHKPLPMN